MLIKHKERYGILFRAIALIVVSLFLYNDIAFALSPELALNQTKFEEKYLARSFLLTDNAAIQYIKLNTNPDLNRLDNGIEISGVKGFLKNIGQIARIDINKITEKPVIYVDTNYFYNETVIGFEKEKISELIKLYQLKKHEYSDMLLWVKDYMNEKDPDIGMTSRQKADEINKLAHQKHPGIDRLYSRIKSKYKKARDGDQAVRAESLLNFAAMHAFYKEAGFILDSDDKERINFAAHSSEVKSQLYNLDVVMEVSTIMNSRLHLAPVNRVKEVVIALNKRGIKIYLGEPGKEYWLDPVSANFYDALVLIEKTKDHGNKIRVKIEVFCSEKCKDLILELVTEFFKDGDMLDGKVKFLGNPRYDDKLTQIDMEMASQNAMKVTLPAFPEGPALFVDSAGNVRELYDEAQYPDKPEHQRLHDALRRLINFDEDASAEFNGKGVRKLTEDEIKVLISEELFGSLKSRAPPAIYIIDDTALENTLPQNYKYLATGLITHAGTWRGDPDKNLHANLFITRSVYETLILSPSSKELGFWRRHEIEGHLKHREATITLDVKDQGLARKIYGKRDAARADDLDAVQIAKPELPYMSERKRGTPAIAQRLKMLYEEGGYFHALNTLHISPYKYYALAMQLSDPVRYLTINYNEAVMLVRDHSIIRKPYNTLTSAGTAKNLILAALDTIPGFKEARESGDVKEMAKLYRKYVIKYASDKRNKRGRQIYGQKAFFAEVGGLGGLMAEMRPYFSKINSPAELLRFAIPQLIDTTNIDALNPLEVELDYWSDINNIKRHTLAALYTITGFEEAHKRGDVPTMSALYRQNVMNYAPRDTKKYRAHGQQAFFQEVGGLAGLMAEKNNPNFKKKNKIAELLRIAIYELIDQKNPDALNKREISRFYWTDKKNAIRHILSTLYTISGFEQAHKAGNAALMAELYRSHVINYEPKDKKGYLHRGQESFFNEVGGLGTLMSHKHNYLIGRGGPAGFLLLAIPELVDQSNPSALRLSEISRSVSDGHDTVPKSFSRDMAKKEGAGEDTAAILECPQHLKSMLGELERAAHGSLDNIKGLRILELGIRGPNSWLLELLHKKSANVHGIGAEAQPSERVSQGTYDAYLKFVPDNSLDIIYSIDSLYPSAIRKLKQIIHSELADKYGYPNAFPRIARALKPEGLLITTVNESEKRYLLTDEELELLGLERVAQYRDDTMPAKIVTVMRKKEPARSAPAGKYSAKDIIDKLVTLQKEFAGRFNSPTNLDVIFSMLPEGEDGAYFTAYKYGDAGEHEDIKVMHAKGEISGVNCVRGELKGDVYGVDPGSYIVLELPFLPDGKYREVKGISREMEFESAVNDTIISARILIKGGVPSDKRFLFKEDTEDRALISTQYPAISSVKSIGDLAELPLSTLQSLTEIGKGSPAEMLRAIKEDGIFAKAMDKNKGLTLETRASPKVIKIVSELGILVPVEPGSSNYCFSDMMRGKRDDDTKTFINALQAVNWSLPIADLREFVKMAIMSEMEKEFVAPEGKTLYHIIEQDVIPAGQRSTLVQAVNNRFDRDNTGPERIVILRKNETITEVVARIRGKDENAIIDVALSDESHIADIEDANVKRIVFKTKNDFIQLHGVIKALRALYDEDPGTILTQLFSVMAGRSPEGSLVMKSGVYVFNLPRISKENINSMPNLNKGLFEALTAA